MMVSYYIHRENEHGDILMSIVSSDENGLPDIARLLKLTKLGVVIHGRNSKLSGIFCQIEKLHTHLCQCAIEHPSGADQRTTKVGETHLSLLSRVSSEAKHQWHHKWASSFNPRDLSSCKDNNSEHEISESKWPEYPLLLWFRCYLSCSVLTYFLLP